MKVYWDVEDHSFIIENENGKRMRVTSEKVENDPSSDYVIMTDAVLVHEVSVLDMVDVGDLVCPDDVAEEGVLLRLIGTDGLMIYCENQWRFSSGERVPFTVQKAALGSKKAEVLLDQVKTRLNKTW